ICMGAIIGKLLEVSGGAQTLAHYIIQAFGEKRSTWALMLTGFIVSIPVFLDVGFIILVPIVYALANRSGLSLLHFAIPLLAGMAVAHAFIPPTPGPVAVAEILNVPLGWMIALGILIGFHTAVISGPVFGKYIARKIVVGTPEFIDFKEHKVTASKNDFLMIVFVITLPLFLILIATTSDMLVGLDILSGENFWVSLLQFLGHPFSALTI